MIAASSTLVTGVMLLRHRALRQAARSRAALQPGDPAPWYAAEQHACEGEWLLVLTEAHVAELDAAVAAALERCMTSGSGGGGGGAGDVGGGGGGGGSSNSNSGGTGGPDLTALSCAADFPLPTLGAVLRAVAADINRGRGFALLRGVPTHRYSRAQAAAAFVGIGLHVGSPVSQNALGHLLGHVADHRHIDHSSGSGGSGSGSGAGKSSGGSGSSSSNSGSSSSSSSSSTTTTTTTSAKRDKRDVRLYRTNQRQRFHTDSCDVVGLLCLHPARSGGRSCIASSLAVRAELARTRPDLLVELRDAGLCWDRKGEVDFRVSDPAARLPFYRGPVLSEAGGRSFCIYDRKFFEGCERHVGVPALTRKQKQAFDALEALAESDALRLDMAFAPGDVQLLSNHTVLHSRSAFVDHEEPERRRHLLRLWLSVGDAGPELPPAYTEGRYASIARGKPRGGIHVAPGHQLLVPLEMQ